MLCYELTFLFFHAGDAKRNSRISIVLSLCRSATMVSNGLFRMPGAPAETRRSTIPRQPGPGTVCLELAKDEHSKVVRVESWTSPKIQPLPKYYPLGHSTVTFKREDFDIVSFAKNMSSVFRAVSVQATYCNDPVRKFPETLVTSAGK